MTRTRAERRISSKKALKRGRTIAKSWGIKNPKEVDHVAHKLRDTPKLCSCSMCCNKRNRRSHEKGREKLTRQERRNPQDDAWREFEETGVSK